MAENYMVKLKLDEAELKSRRAFFEIEDEDLKRLAALRGFAEQHMDEFVQDLYVLILGHAEARRVFPNEQVLRHAQREQREYFLGLFAGRCDLPYVEDRLRIGLAHERVGVPPKWYVGAYGRYLRMLFDRLTASFDAKVAHEAYRSATKLVAFDMALALDTYIAASQDTIARHQQAIRELSTPVIQVHDDVLLLPLVGTMDTARAEQVMETVLTRVVETKARVVITDIAGVPVVDTRVADHLLQTTEAARLLGAQSVLTGISPHVAKTIVRLGIDITAMHTRARLSEGIQLAMDLAAKRAGERGVRA